MFEPYALILAATDPRRPRDRAVAALERVETWQAWFLPAARNRVGPLCFHALDEWGLLERLPGPARAALEDQYRRVVIDTRIHLAALDEITAAFRSGGIEAVLMRGLSAGVTLYGKPFLRPFSDLDLLTRRDAVSAACAALVALGYAYADAAAPAAYYERFHLHRHLWKRATNVHVELHWALDHAHATFTPDVDALPGRGRRVDWEGQAWTGLDSVDRLLVLGLHLAKHAPLLVHAPTREEVFAMVFADRQLVWVADIAHALARSPGLAEDEALWARAQAWGLVPVLRGVLRVVDMLYPGLVPAGRMAGRPRGPGVWMARAYAASASDGAPDRGGGLRAVLTRWRGAVGFRWIRLVDVAAIVFPPWEFMARRYGVHGRRAAWRYPVHSVTAAWRLAAHLVAVWRVRG